MSPGPRTMTPQEAFAAALKIVGGKTALAERLDITPQAIDGWGDIVPKKRVVEVADAVRDQIASFPTAPTEHDLRPDLFPRPVSRRPARTTKAAKTRR